MTDKEHCRNCGDLLDRDSIEGRCSKCGRVRRQQRHRCSVCNIVRAGSYGSNDMLFICDKCRMGLVDFLQALRDIFDERYVQHEEED